MKIRNTFLCLFILVNVSFSQDSYSRVKIFLDDLELKEISKLGIETDHGIHKVGRYFVNDLADFEIELLENRGIAYEIQIANVEAHYATQNNHDHIHTSPRSSECEEFKYPYKTPVNYEYGSMGGYHTYEEMIATLASMQTKFPHLISRLSPIGDHKTQEGRPIQWLKVGNKPNMDEDDKPEVLYTALHHAREPNSLAQMIFFLWYLLENYETDATVRYIVENTELYFIPCVNPDGYIFNETTNPDGGGLWRKNRAIINESIAGVDLNRNYGYEWAHDNTGSSSNPNSNTYRGPSAFSESESQAVRDFCLQHDFKVALNYHTFGNLLIYPWGFSNGETPDDSTFKGFAKAMTSENDYLAGTGIETVGYTVNGDSDDWMYGEAGILSLTPEVGSGSFGFWPPKSAIDQLNKSALKQNFVAALLLHQYVEIEVIHSLEQNIEINYTKYSLDEEDVVIQIESLDERLVFLQDEIVSPLKHLETRSATIPYNINTEDVEGVRELQYLVARNLKGVRFQDTFVIKLEVDLDTVFSDSGGELDLWVAEGWGLSEIEYVSDSTSFTDSPSGNYAANTISTFKLNEAIDLSDAEEAVLEYNAKWDIEADFDYAQVLISADGLSYKAICTDYTSTGNNFQAADEPLYEGQQDEWVSERISLEEYLGGFIWLQFIMVSDEFEHRDGIYIDDIIIKARKENASGIVSEIEFSTRFSLTPNPVSSSLYIRELDALSKPVRRYLSSSLGHEIKELVVTESDILVDDLPAGIYVVTTIYNDGASQSSKFIKL